MEMKFNSQTCTSREQSERLLALGLKKETADMVLLKEMFYDVKNHCTRDGENYLIRPIDYIEGEEHRGHIPAWSLHRLIEMLPSLIQINELNLPTFHHYAYLELSQVSVSYRWEDYDADDRQLVGFYGDGLFAAVVDAIEWLIKEGYFNKEYLVNQAEIEEHCKGVQEYLDYIKGEED